MQIILLTGNYKQSQIIIRDRKSENFSSRHFFFEKNNLQNENILCYFAERDRSVLLVNKKILDDFTIKHADALSPINRWMSLSMASAKKLYKKLNIDPGLILEYA
ncbi:MAG: hypothetical protein LBE91_14155 [Tannerella sp.]|jgi:hypothetical protein|nr:hypothetical protein [Tannerella sp.]